MQDFFGGPDPDQIAAPKTQVGGDDQKTRPNNGDDMPETQSGEKVTNLSLD